MVSGKESKSKWLWRKKQGERGATIIVASWGMTNTCTVTQTNKIYHSKRDSIHVWLRLRLVMWDIWDCKIQGNTNQTLKPYKTLKMVTYSPMNSTLFSNRNA